MLISQNDILQCTPPFLMQSASNDWLLVDKICVEGENYILSILEMSADEFIQRSILLNEAPFHVGAEVWELEYGATLMTLQHASVADHPARRLWQKWLSKNKK